MFQTRRLRASSHQEAAVAGTTQSQSPTTRAAPALVPLSTPHHPKSGLALDHLLLSLEKQWKLGLRAGGKQSPAQSQSLAGKARSKIQYLFYSSRPALDAALDNFTRAAPRFSHDKRLELLDGLLRERVPAPRSSPRSRTTTPVTPCNQPPTSLLGKCGSALVALTLVSLHYLGALSRDGTGVGIGFSLWNLARRDACEASVSTCALEDRANVKPATPQPQISRLNLHGRRAKGEDKAEFHVPDLDPGSPTDVDTDDEIVTDRLTSPSPSFGSSNRRPKPAYPSEATPREASEIFKKPALNTTCSLSVSEPSFASVNTSFGQNTKSSQETMATSISTSFASHDEVTQKRRQLLGQINQMQRQLHNLEALEHTPSQAPSRESNSTYGSVDEDTLLEQTCQEWQEIKPIGMKIKSSNSAHSPAPEPVVIADSPSKLPYYLRDIPVQNLFVEPLAAKFVRIPFFLLFICCRLSMAAREPIGNLLEQLHDDAVITSPSKFWSAVGAKFYSRRVESNAVWTAMRRSFEGFTFKGKVSFSPRLSSSIFRIEISPIEAEKSCQLQRMFGSDRFLFLTFPSFNENRPAHITQGQMSHIKEQWKIWLMREHSFLGRMWRVFHVEPTKRRKTQRPDDSSETRVVLFATEGHGIKKIPVGHMLDSFMPLARNQKQNFCKAYARLDLALSRTTPTHIFKPSQIRRIPDRISDGTPEATEFNDTGLDWSEKCDPQVMNDGCARISVGAALKVWEMYRSATGSDEPFPSAFQGRIRGAKGMWMVSAEAHTRDEAHLDIWIEITDSQCKFEPAQDDLSDATYNRHRLTFNHVQHSFVNGSTDLHISFIPALVDRGVGKPVIANLMNKYMDMERRSLLEMLTDPVKLHNWVTKQGSAAPISGVFQWQAALPLATTEKVKLLLRAGFTPSESPYLAKVLIKLINQQQAIVEQKLRAPLGSATYLYGLADPEAVLQPGEVHISFSSPFIDEYSRQTYRHLDGLEILVARQPACRRSDVQKLRAIAHPKLSHLRDVIVFSVRGEYPLAGKLQGGDYDGDTFWICWDNILVEPFKNAPAPLNPPKYADSCIRKDLRTLNEVMDTSDLSDVDAFLKEAFDFRLTKSFLGKATVLHEKVAYDQNRISSKEIDALCDLHDLLVDAPKQAYKFDDEDYNELLGKLLKCKIPPEPAYKQAMTNSKNNRDIGANDKMTPESYNWNPNNILDYLYFDVVRKHNTTTRQLLSDALPKELEDDPELRLPYYQLRELPNKALKTELQTLLVKFEEIVIDWNSCLGNRSESTIDRYGNLLDQCYASFCSLHPSAENSLDPEIARLIFPYKGPSHPTLWETIRASAFYAQYPKKHTLVWQMAGRELAKLKADGNPHTYHVVPAIFADMKAKPHKVPRLDEDEMDDELQIALDKIA